MEKRFIAIEESIKKLSETVVAGFAKSNANFETLSSRVDEQFEIVARQLTKNDDNFKILGIYLENTFEALDKKIDDLKEEHSKNIDDLKEETIKRFDNIDKRFVNVDKGNEHSEERLKGLEKGFGDLNATKTGLGKGIRELLQTIDSDLRTEK